MPEALLPDDPKTVDGLQSLERFLIWFHGMPKQRRERLLHAVQLKSESLSTAIAPRIRALMDDRTSESERLRELGTISDMLFADPEDPETGLAGGDAQSEPAPPRVPTGSMEDVFIERVRNLMERKRISQTDLAGRIGCTQPAISQMLNRRCRPQKQTILKIADALGVDARDLWPDLEVAEMLDAVESFQSDYMMTEDEARALRDAKPSGRPKLQPKGLPSRK